MNAAREAREERAGPVERPGKSVCISAIVVEAGDQASKRFVEFFTANIRSVNTRRACARAVSSFLR